MMDKGKQLNRKEAHKQKREHLIALSSSVKIWVDSGRYASINAALLAQYSARTGAKVFKTFKQWKEEGKSIRKGEKSFCVWGRPKEGKKAAEKEGGQEEAFQYWPLCYLFSEQQVK